MLMIALRDTGAALKRTGLGVAVGPRGGVTGALAGAGGGFGTSAFGRLLLVLLTDLDLVCPTLRNESVRNGGTLSLLSSRLSRILGFTASISHIFYLRILWFGCAYFSMILIGQM